ncbi:Retrovirus-related Pol polyprotein from type-2 retrotransposable element R2DM [Sesamum angolense]|uniref:Retrovirus-related Pol polyprotein from type-2 retrotransposable element R2DM n=1 Tax=Sesamum angolense TaxID=2727404 RepID=A0AAE1VZ41_9LAMI|nr:Retrovirus-related Pol polyprotein from type-2 retrotransposable element R2DM [Sesamum angolense]
MTLATNKQTPPLLAVYLWIFPGLVGGQSPWTDGFSSGFFKAAWPVVGGEVSNAIIDFFKTGRLLKQLNATLLTLIPKRNYGVTHKPNTKCFVPGRLICDNVLLAQEFFSGYNQCRLPPRCALKVDLRKAYDTVEWDFLIATLRMFGFPAIFIRWIEECVTSAHYSVVVNGGVHGFFSGARGLRQGDPMSPYLFVLVMEVLHMILQQLIEQDGEFQYHWRCQELNLFQLSFADDLLLLCKADVRSVNLFRQGLDRFATLSGLKTNPQKSQLIISKAVSGIRDALLATLGFQEGQLPVRYLGLPLILARLSITDCQPLLQKIDSRIKGWEGVQLSFAGRVQLIKSVLISFEVYWATAFILPKGIIKEMMKRLRTFLWKGTTASGYPKVSWEAVCRPIEEGGLGIKDMLALNRALMSKHLWAVIKQDRTSIWVDWIIQVRLRDCSIWTVKENKGAWGWRKMLSLRQSLMAHIHYRVGNGDSVSLWHDPWHPLGPLISRFPRGPQLTSTGLLDKLSMVIKDGQWNWP